MKNLIADLRGVMINNWNVGSSILIYYDLIIYSIFLGISCHDRSPY